MRRISVLALVIAVGAMGMAAGAYQQPAAGEQQPLVVEVEKLKDNLFVLKGGGGNTAVFVQSNGVTVVDTKLPGWGKPILDKIRELTEKPVTTIVNTHTHGDHVSGNVEFPEAVAVIVHENTKSNMQKMASPPGSPAQGTPAPSIFAANKGRGLPTETFTDRVSLGSGADRVELHYFGRGHTNGDTLVVFPAHGVMHMGDLFPGKQLPFMDANNGGSGVEYADTLRKAHDGVSGVESIITGHSTLMTRADLLEYSEFLRAFVNAVRQGKDAGQSAEAIAEKWTPPARFAGYAPTQASRLRASVELILQELQ